MYFAARDSAVRVEPIGFAIDMIYPTGGFVGPTKRHVVVPADAIGVGRGVRVVFPGGQAMHARAVAIDDKHHVAVLALDGDAPIAPLELSDAPLDVGTEVASVIAYEDASVANPDDTVVDARLQVGHVANAGDRTVMRVDGAPTITRGSPVFTCEGKLVAMRDWDELVQAKSIRELTPAASPIDDASWSLAHFHLGMPVQTDGDRAWIGIGTGLAAVYDDRWQLRFGFAGLGRIPKRSERSDGSDVSAGRLQLESTLGYRFLLSEHFPAYLVPQIGGVGRVDLATRTDNVYTATDARCFTTPGPCGVTQDSVRHTNVSWTASPVVGLSLVAIASASYQFQLDVADPSRSTHQFFIGLEF